MTWLRTPTLIGPGKGLSTRMALPPFGDSWSWVRCSGSTSHPPSFFSGSSLPFSPPASSRRLQGGHRRSLGKCSSGQDANRVSCGL